MKTAIMSRITIFVSAIVAVLGVLLYLALAISALSGAPARQTAVPVTGQDLATLLQTCRLEKASCHTYPLAVATGSLTTSRLFKAPDLFCLPASVRDADLPAAISRFIDAKPEALKWPAPLVVIATFMDTFPCPHAAPSSGGVTEKDTVK